MAAEHIRHWRVGNVDIARIVEVYGFADNIAMLLPNADAEFVKQFAWLRPHHATPEGLMIISFQCFVLRSRGKTVMIDTCIGADRKREFDVFCNLKTTFLEDLAAAGFPHEQISTVLCTHLHFDHVGWNTRLVASGCPRSRTRAIFSAARSGTTGCTCAPPAATTTCITSRTPWTRW
jgi:glyoxylase-like metal-dependent hydrolase (beta-lactamase superfamily II)